MLSKSSAFVVLFATTLSLSQETKQCFYPNKYPSNDTPCDSSASVSACCGQNSICLSNGLCLTETTISRGSCTSEDWLSPCPDICRDRNPGGGMAIMPCSTEDDDWNWFTCGVGQVCNSTNQFQIEGRSEVMLRKEQVEQLGYEGGVNVSATDVLNVTRSTSGGAAQTVRVGKGYSAAEMAGVGVGVGIPLLIALFGAVVVIVRQKKRLNDVINTNAATARNDTWSTPPTTTDHQLSPLPGYKSPPYGHLQQDGYGFPAGQGQIPRELDTGGNVQELSAQTSVQLPNVKSP